MAKFITGNELEDAFYNILFEAKRKLVIVSPYIKLDSYFKEHVLKKHQQNPQLSILVVFGKNEGKVSRSCSLDDFNYFKSFPNITIVYVPNLHAKYYGNESKGVITSINLYDYSFKNNIEYGVYSEVNSLVDAFTTDLLNKKSADAGAYEYSMDLAEKSDVVFAKRPVVEKKLLNKLTGGLFDGVIGGKNILSSETLFDATEALFRGRKYDEKRLSEFPDKIDSSRPEATVLIIRDKYESEKSTTSSSRKSLADIISKPRQSTEQTGYCIRKGVEIPFNPDRPFCYDAFQVWVQYGDPDFPEQYCHKTGKPSYGKTSMCSPILRSW